MKTEELAALLYERYCMSVGGLAHDGQPLPGWGEFRSDERKRKQSDAWVAVADQVLKLAHEGGTGAGLIAMERERQMTKEGWDAKHDDEHKSGCLAAAAASYALSYVAVHGKVNESIRQAYSAVSLDVWPFYAEWWKPTHENPIRQLTKAGALIAAEIDRLQRAKEQEST